MHFTHEGASGCRHASAFVQDKDGQKLVWFEGTREAAEDVKIRQANLKNGQISDWFDTHGLTQAIVPRQSVRVLGNTIGLPHFDGGFIATTVSLGGWAGSSLALGRANKNGILEAKRLYTHAYGNRSHLVRNPAVCFADGHILIPAYFEARISVGDMIRLSPDGVTLWKSRLGQGRQLIQPCLHILDSDRAFVLCRGVDRHRRLYRSDTEDGAKHGRGPG